jgi:periplasmic divalent cation tolerance protein
MSEHVQVQVTTENREEAEKLIKLAVEGRFAACGQISGPVTSSYWWHGKIEHAEEVLLTLKTTAAKLSELVEVINSNHSYETPEIVALPLVGGLGPYLTWITEETGAPKPAE